MKITKAKLKQIIKEELSRVLDENVPNPEFRSKVAAGGEERLSGQENLNWLAGVIGSAGGIAGGREEFIDLEYINAAAEEYLNATGLSASAEGADLNAFIEWAHESGNERAQQWKNQLKATRDHVRRELEEGIGDAVHRGVVGAIGGAAQRVSQTVKGATKPTLGLQSDPKNAKVAAKNIAHEIARYLEVEGGGYLAGVMIAAAEEAEKTHVRYRKRARLSQYHRSQNYGLGGVIKALKTLKMTRMSPDDYDDDDYSE